MSPIRSDGSWPSRNSRRTSGRDACGSGATGVGAGRSRSRGAALWSRARPRLRREVTPVGRSSLPLLAALFALVVCLHPGRAGAQVVTRGDSTGFRFRGQVRDVRSGRPIPRALVEISELNALGVADDSGYFSFDHITAGSYHLTAQALGYASIIQRMTVHRGEAALVWLKPQPIVLRNLDVVVREQSLVHKLNQRVRTTGYEYTILGPGQLQRSLAPDLTTLIQARSPVEFTLCSGQSSGHSMVGPVATFRPEVDEQSLGMTPACVRYHGRLEAVNVVYNDLGIPASTILSSSPHNFYLVQLIPDLHLLRLYSRSYVRSLARRGWNPQPICTVCGRMGRSGHKRPGGG